MINAMYPHKTLFYGFPECLKFFHQPGETNRNLGRSPMKEADGGMLLEGHMEEAKSSG
jgi:hypothetical protein